MAGLVGGLVFGLLLALVATPLIGAAEQAAHGGHTHGDETHNAAEGAVDGVAATIISKAVSVVAGVLWGLLLGGVVFGVVHYFLEPALPGTGAVRSLALGAAGFLTVSGAPWLVLPPQPPGVEAALPPETRLLWYGGMMAVGALVVGLCGVAHQRAADRRPTVRALATVLPLALLAIPVALGPATAGGGQVPEQLAAAHRWTVVLGQVALWATIATVHAWIGLDDGAIEAAAVPVAAD